MENTDSSGAGNTQQKEYPVIDGLCHEFKQLLRSLEPSPKVTEHFRNARIEVLKGMRQVIDNRIEHLSRSSAQPGRKIVVE
jgi:hypothetical protein